MSWRFVLFVSSLPVLLSAFLCACVVATDWRYADLHYFIEQMQKHQQYGRQLYTQIEFPYGPLIFYVPIWAGKLLAPTGISTRGAYILTLLSEQFAGGLLFAWVLDSLPIARKLKKPFFLICVVGWFFWGLGLNYTMFRFLAPIASLIFTAKQERIWRFAAVSAVSQCLCLAISPEMGFAFMSAACALAIYLCYQESWFWWPAVIAPLVGVGCFLGVAGSGYLHMLALFAKGTYNFIVEPTPYVLIFLVAVVLIVPLMLARTFVLRLRAFKVLGALYVFSLALLPVAFGRADAAHILYNGIGFYILSMVAVSMFSLVRPAIWLLCVTVASLFPLVIGYFQYYDVLNKTFLFRGAVFLQGDHLRRLEARLLEKRFPSHARGIRVAFLEPPWGNATEPFDLNAMERWTEHAPVATPYHISNSLESTLKRSGHYVPLFYAFQIAIIDRSAEEREIQELRQYQWILTPATVVLPTPETPQATNKPLGSIFPYKMKHEPYPAGKMLLDELASHWQVAGVVSGYRLYHQKPSPHHL